MSTAALARQTITDDAAEEHEQGQRKTRRGECESDVRDRPGRLQHSEGERDDRERAPERRRGLADEEETEVSLPEEVREKTRHEHVFYP